MTSLTPEQSHQLAALRARRREADRGFQFHPKNMVRMFAEAMDLLDALVENTEDGEWYFLRDSLGPESCSWWIYNPKRDRWVPFYGDGDITEDPDDVADAVATITEVVAGRGGSSSSLFKGFDEGAAYIIERFGASA